LVEPQPYLGLGGLVGEVAVWHSVRHTHPVGLLWTSEQLVAEAATTHHTTNTRDEHACPQREWNPRSQQSSGLGFRSTP